MKEYETTPTGGRFPLGRVVATPGAIEALAQANVDGRELLSKHHRGEWGELSEDDKRENEFSVDKYLRIFSSYRISDDEKIWIITESDRRVTTLSFAERVLSQGQGRGCLSTRKIILLHSPSSRFAYGNLSYLNN
jgi:hypothetical protein